MYLFFDTETTGLPRNWKAPVTDLNNWPRLVQLAFIFTDSDGKILDCNDYIIKPIGFTIPEEWHYKLFRENFEEAHNAMVDIRVTAKCFWELKKRKII